MVQPIQILLDQLHFSVSEIVEAGIDPILCGLLLHVKLLHKTLLRSGFVPRKAYNVMRCRKTFIPGVQAFQHCVIPPFLRHCPKPYFAYSALTSRLTSSRTLWGETTSTYSLYCSAHRAMAQGLQVTCTKSVPTG